MVAPWIGDRHIPVNTERSRGDLGVFFELKSILVLFKKGLQFARRSKELKPLLVIQGNRKTSHAIDTHGPFGLAPSFETNG